MNEKNPSFLKHKYTLHKSPEVDRLAKRTKQKKGVEISDDPEARIQNYLDYLNGIIHNEDAHEREQKLAYLKDFLHKTYVIKPENIPERFFENQERLNREHGMGRHKLTKEMRAELTATVIGDQQKSLDAWFDYLANPDTTYPDWFKYFVLREVTGMGAYNLQTNTYSGRKPDTVAPFPELNREALAKVLDQLQEHPNPPEVKFSRLYAEEVRKLIPLDEEQLKETKGEWRTFPQGSDPNAVTESLQGYATGLCIAGHATAATYLQNGDLHIYYSLNPDGEPVIPRAAIHRVADTTTEVRGVGKQQNTDPYIDGVVTKKLKEFPDGEAYAEKSADMKRLGEIEEKIHKNKKLTKDDLVFFYELDHPIHWFGYEPDTGRIDKLRQQRKDAGLLEHDQCVIFECEPEQIAHSPDDVVHNVTAGIETRAYVGPLFKDIFKTFGDLEHIYTAFPERPIKHRRIEVGGKSKDTLIKEMEDNNIWIADWANSMMDNPAFTTSKEPYNLDVIELSVHDLGFPNGATVQEIYDKAWDLGLEPVPPETGPHFRLSYTDQPEGEWLLMGMKPLTGSGGAPDVFGVSCDGGRLGLDVRWARPGLHWSAGFRVVFRPRT